MEWVNKGFNINQSQSLFLVKTCNEKNTFYKQMPYFKEGAKIYIYGYSCIICYCPDCNKMIITKFNKIKERMKNHVANTPSHKHIITKEVPNPRRLICRCNNCKEEKILTRDKFLSWLKHHDFHDVYFKLLPCVVLFNCECKDCIEKLILEHTQIEKWIYTHIHHNTIVKKREINE